MRPRIKICGMTNKRDAAKAVDLGVDAVGFILYSKSPRYINPQDAIEIAKALPPFIHRVVVVVNMSLESITELDKSGSFDVIQLHGDEQPSYCKQLASQTSSHLVKALGLPGKEGRSLHEYEIDAFLLDKSSAKYGGTGQVFNWDLAKAFMAQTDKPCILAGGLSCLNIKKAISEVQPYAVDVCSGVELEPGLKDHNKMKEFVEICQQS
ncbi:MAG: phosphoribosylanthranilate isomerase [Verrucomicrobiota bacterium]